jgi:hypothetical protein
MSEQREKLSRQTFRRPGVVNPRRFVDEYCFELEGLSEMVRVRIFGSLDEDWYEVAQSHYLQPPGASGPSMSETQRYGSVEEALNDVLGLFSAGYEQAVGAGHLPDDSWLMPSRELDW